MRLAMVVLIILVLFHGGAAGLRAQTGDEPYVRILTIPEVRVYISPAENGTEEEAAYFKTNFEQELIGAAYAVAETQEDSDFYMALSITRQEGEDPPNDLNVTLFNTRSGQEIVTLNWAYGAVEEMGAWNLYIIYQAMANAPIVKLLPDAELTGAREGNWNPAPSPPGEGPHTMAFYLGLRAGGFFNLYTFQTIRGYEGGTGRAFSGEGALLAEFHPWRFLSIQAEAAVLYESFVGTRETGENAGRYNGAFSALSLHIPLFVKAPIDLGRFSLSPFIGAYYVLPLGPMSANFNGNERQYDWSLDPPLGISLGIDLGIPLGPGKITGGLRCDYDIGTSAGEDSAGPVYSRYRVGFTLGWAWKFAIKKKDREQKAPAAAGK
ncbi:MAG: hypothetical protein LBG57_10180 [Treponema sp.]|nr:hypothetical protein [Treponema sp.]